jgi:hypothetical protein
MATALALIALQTAPPARAGDGMVMTTPVFDQIVSYHLPEDFIPSFEQANQRFYIQEAVPVGESVDNWSEMITMTGTKDSPGAPQTLQTAAEGLAGHYQQACPETFAKQSLGPSVIDGHEAMTMFLGCGTAATAQGNVSETAVIRFIKGPSGHYTVQWAEHGAARKDVPAYDAGHWKRRLADLSDIRLCDRVDGEKPPFPSCIFKK